MNTTVITVDDADFGVGPGPVTFVGCHWHIDEGGTLHIVREGKRGNCAAFAPGSWRAVTDGEIVSAAEVIGRSA